MPFGSRFAASSDRRLYRHDKLPVTSGMSHFVLGMVAVFLGMASSRRIRLQSIVCHIKWEK